MGLLGEDVDVQEIQLRQNVRENQLGQNLRKNQLREYVRKNQLREHEDHEGGATIQMELVLSPPSASPRAL